MIYEIKVTKRFLKELKQLSKRYKSILDDLETFEKDLLNNPFQGRDLGRDSVKSEWQSSLKEKEKVEEQELLHLFSLRLKNILI